MEFKINFSNIEDEKLLYSVLKKLDGEYSIKIEAPKAAHNQFKYYRGVIIRLIHIETGQDEETIHETLLEMYSKELTMKEGKFVWEIKRSKEMSRVEFSKYIKYCIAFAEVFLGIQVPEVGRVQNLMR